VVDVSREAVEVNSNRLAKEMQSGGGQQFERGDLLCLKLKDPRAEAIWIADKIRGCVAFLISMMIACAGYPGRIVRFC
jgi:hypothetical protein